MMIRIPVVMTREIESWPCEELTYCSAVNVRQEWGFAAPARPLHAAPPILCNNWLKKTKYCAMGHLKGACRSKVCLHHIWPWFFYKLSLSLSARRRGEKKRHTTKIKGELCCFGSCLVTQTVFVPSNTSIDLKWSRFSSALCFFSFWMLFLVGFFSPFASLAEIGPKSEWKQKLREAFRSLLLGCGSPVSGHGEY